jgi:hypothetical protein
LTDQPDEKRRRWIIGDGAGIDYCISDPGLEVDLFVETDSRTVTLVWYGDMALRRALDDGLIDLHGPRDLRDAFPSWLQLNLLAGVPRKQAPPRSA